MKHLLGILFLIPALSFAQEATVNAVLDTQEILIGDQINLDLTVEIADGSTVAWPVYKDTITGQLEIVQSSLIDTAKNESGETVYHQRLVITSFDTGFIVLPPVDFLFNADSLLLSTEPQLIFVSDIPVEMEADIKDIKEPYEVPFNWKKWIKWFLIALLVIGLIIGAILLWEKYRKKPEQVQVARPKPKRPAHEIALEKLEALRQKKLWQNDKVKEFYIELSDIIREYIEFQFDILALEMTTDETMAALRFRGIEEEKIRPLEAMLRMADLAKFAKYKPVSNENEQCFQAATAFVNQTLVMPLDETNEEENEG